MGMIDDAFAAADAELGRRSQDEQQAVHEQAIYDQQVAGVVRDCIEAVRIKAEAFNAHPKNQRQAAVQANGTPAVIRRASDTGIPDRRIEIAFRHDLKQLSWRYDMTPSIYLEPEMVDGGDVEFHVVGETLELTSGTPQAFADMVLDGFIRDCAMDYAVRRT